MAFIRVFVGENEPFNLGLFVFFVVLTVTELVLAFCSPTSWPVGLDPEYESRRPSRRVVTIAPRRATLSPGGMAYDEAESE